MDEIWPIADTKKLFSTFKDFEYYLTASGKRGHFIHQFEVFLFGLNLIVLFSKKRNLTDLFGIENLKDVIEAWLITAAVHDFGYPLEVVSAINSKLSNLYKELEMNSLSNVFKGNEKKFKDMIISEIGMSELRVGKDKEGSLQHPLLIHDFIADSIKTSLNITGEETSEITDDLIKSENHGYVSAIILCRKLVQKLLETSNYEDLKKVQIFRSLKFAIAAIALHALSIDKKELIKKINFDTSPFVYLLYIIDNIQEWSRNIVTKPKYPIYQLNDFIATQKEINLEYMLHHDDWTKEMISEQEKYISAQEKKLKLPSGPSKKLCIRLNITFKSNDNHRFKSINVDF